jgi:hypothetical protein
MKPYFYVYQPETKYTKFKHKSIEEAEKEASRLASIHQGTTFEILCCVSRVKVTQEKWERISELKINNAEMGIPF